MSEDFNMEDLGLEERVDLPPKILIYGTEGIGKTSFGVNSNKPVFIPTEQGLAGYPNVKAFPLSKSLQDFLGHLQTLCTKQHPFNSLVIDSADWLEPLVWAEVCRLNGETTIEKVGGGYGKGYAMALDLWRGIFEALDYLNKEKGMMIIIIAHAAIKRYENPETDAYDRYSIKLQDGKSTSAAGLLMEYCDIVLFANHPVYVRKEEKVFNKERKVVTGSGGRMLYTQERPAFRAKNRYNLPPEIEFDEAGGYWSVIASHIPAFNKQTIEKE